MIYIPPTIPPKRVEKSYVSEKNPHHQKDKKKKNDEHEPSEPEDKIDVSIDINKPSKNKNSPQNPLQGHIDINA